MGRKMLGKIKQHDARHRPKRVVEVEGNNLSQMIGKMKITAWSRMDTQ